MAVAQHGVAGAYEACPKLRDRGSRPRAGLSKVVASLQEVSQLDISKVVRPAATSSVSRQASLQQAHLDDALLGGGKVLVLQG